MLAWVDIQYFIEDPNVFSIEYKEFLSSRQPEPEKSFFTSIDTQDIEIIFIQGKVWDQNRTLLELLINYWKLKSKSLIQLKVVENNN